MALVNTALEMARRGRSVLLIDFDLEAPGLTTFAKLRPDQARQGVVEFVSEYIRSGTSPDVRDYIYKAEKLAGTSGDIYVMPAGREDDNYRQSLARIDWVDLYENKDGFVFFEDMKLQMQAFAGPDYLLVDSRTGHTDVEGICTRHLPESVVVLFFPNEQNLNGLEGVCASIRAEKDSALHKDISLHFVMSNVPDLDDEDEILRNRIRSFRSQLQFPRLTATIHHYNSLSLLNQSVFVQDRPKSRLAKEYKKLVDELLKSNPGDRGGSLEYLREIADGGPRLNRSNKLAKIDESFPKDPEIQVAIARVRYNEGRFSDALPHVEHALSVEPSNWQALYYRALINSNLDNDDQAATDLMACLDTHDIDEIHILRSFRLMTGIRPGLAAEALETPAVQRLDPESKYELAVDLARSEVNWMQSIPLFLSLWDGGIVRPGLRWQLRHQLSLILIRAGRWDDAISLLSDSTPLRARRDLEELIDEFNIAMAHWGKTSTPSPERFRRIVERNSEPRPYTDGNYPQCLSIANWAIGQVEVARGLLAEAVESGKRHVGQLFSCWRYANVHSKDFLADCDDISRLLNGENLLPVFMRRAGTA